MHSQAAIHTQPPPDAIWLSGLELSEYRFAPNTELPEHSHFNASMNLIMSGCLTEFAHDLDRPFSSMMCSYYPPCHTHRVVIGHLETCGFHVEFSSAWLERVDDYLDVPVTSADRNDCELAWLLTRLYLEYRQPDDLSSLAVEGLLLESLASVARSRQRAARSEPSWLMRVTRLLDLEFRQPPGLNVLALEAGVHPVHLSRAFRRFRGMGPAEYVRRLRVHFACSELLRKNIRLIDLAADAGFADQSHFTRSFKLVTGMTPCTFRRRLGRTNYG